MSKFAKHLMRGIIVRPSSGYEVFRSHSISGQYKLFPIFRDMRNIPRRATFGAEEINSLVSGMGAFPEGILRVLAASASPKILVAIIQSVMVFMVTMALIFVRKTEDETVHPDWSLPPIFALALAHCVKTAVVFVPPSKPLKPIQFFKTVRAYLGELALGKGDETIVFRRGHARSLSAGRFIRRCKRLIPFILPLFIPAIAHAQYYPVQAYCIKGATPALVSGLASTNTLQGVVPSCTVNVFLAGTTTPATIYSDAIGTPLANPFTAAPTGQINFYAVNTAQYAIVVSGGIPPNNYSSPVTIATSATAGGAFLSLSGGRLYGAFFAPAINGEMYPAACGSASPPSWCSGTTPDAWYRAACTQLPAAGGFINLLGLTGTAGTGESAGNQSFTCGTPTKHVITLADNGSRLDIDERDGGVPFPEDNGSMLLGQGAGQCNFSNNGIHLASTANVSAIVAQAHNDGTQEALTVNGVCIHGAPGATVSKGLMWADRVFTNTSFNENNVQICNTACILVQDVGGSMTINGNLLNALDGINTITGSSLIIQAVTAGNTAIEVSGNSIQGANGGGTNSEIKVIGNGAGIVNEGIWIHNNYIERAGYAGTTGSLVGIQITDCQSCTIRDVTGLGTFGGNDFINVSQTAGGRTQNVVIENVLGNSYTNVVNDTITPKVYPHSLGYNVAHHVVNAGFSDMPCSPLAQFPGTPYMGQCWTDPASYRQSINSPTGVQQYAWLSDLATTIQSLDADVMSGQGSFSTGSGSLGTNFVQSGCLSGQGLTCTYTRTSSAPPPGFAFSQQVQITANTDPFIGFNGIQYSPSVSFVAGQPYVISFWGKGDGTFTGIPTFLLWVSTTPVFYCTETASGAFTTSWKLYSFLCVPSVSGSAFISVSAETPVGATGSFWVGGFTFNPTKSFSTAGLTLASNGPYGIGPTVPTNSAAGIPLPTCNSSTNGNQRTVSDAASHAAAYGAGGGQVTAAVICSFNGSAYAWYVQ